MKGIYVSFYLKETIHLYRRGTRKEVIRWIVRNDKTSVGVFEGTHTGSESEVRGINPFSSFTQELILAEAFIKKRKRHFLTLYIIVKRLIRSECYKLNSYFNF